MIVRVTLTPDSRASTRFPPTAYAWRPNTVIWVTISRMPTAATHTTSINGMPLEVHKRSSGNRTTPITMKPGTAAPRVRRPERTDRMSEKAASAAPTMMIGAAMTPGTAPRPKAPMYGGAGAAAFGRTRIARAG